MRPTTALNARPRKRDLGRPGWIRIAALACLLSVLVAACGGEEGGDAAGEEATGAAQAPDPGGQATDTGADVEDEAADEGGELRVVVVSEPRALHRGLDNNVSSTGIAAMVVEDLVAADPADLSPTTDGLVSDWERVDDLTWRLTVLEGVKFHNGEPFDADAAAFNILRSRDDATGSTAPYFEPIEDAVAVDDTTVEVTTTVPLPFLPTLMTIVQVFPPAHAQEVSAEVIGTAPVGTGPFLFEEWAAGQYISMTPNPDYRDGAPALDRVTISWAAEPGTRVSLLRTGEADIIAKLPPSTATELEAEPGYEVQRETSLMILHLYFNVNDPPLDDVRVRRAVAHAIDRDLLVDSIFEGEGAVPTANVFQPIFSSAGGHGDAYLTYDPEAAQALLAEVGDVEPLDFYWPVGRYMLDNQVGEAVSGMLEAVGFQVNRQPTEAGAFFDLLFTNDMAGMHLLGGGATFAHEDGGLSSKFKTDGVITYCAHETVDELGAEALQLEEGPERDALYNDIERFLLTEHVCPVPLYLEVDSYAMSDRVQGFEARGNESWDQLRSVRLQD